MRKGEIYHIYPVDDNGELIKTGYVGQTVRTAIARVSQHYECAARGVKHPLYYAMRKYGLDNFIFEVLEKVDVDLLDEREVYWIDKLGTYRGGYNLTPGGRQYRIVDEAEFVRFWNEGKSVLEISALTGYSWPAVEIFLDQNGITAEERILRSKQRARYTGFNGAQVVQIDPNTNEILAHFENLGDAGASVGVSYCSISKSCRGETGIVGGFMWRYKGDICEYDLISGLYTRASFGIKIEKNEVTVARSTPVVRLTVNWEYIDEFPSVLAAAEHIGSPGTHITRACRSTRTVKNYRFMYKSEFNNKKRGYVK